ncbi:hypothetical protein H5410_025188 [Solanum commersonii]|uniref:Uncharacterized protein n=1 Tax=Solanum commersonii TaxID=4109 RepID=A0A9J5YV74_SOLCO|nr:hypothetical protein H5410_025188 [Solanum commersonii]
MTRENPQPLPFGCTQEDAEKKIGKGKARDLPDLVQIGHRYQLPSNSHSNIKANVKGVIRV